MKKKDALRFYIQTRTIFGLNATAAIHEELITAHEPEVVSYPTVQRWCKKTNDGIMELEDNPRSGRPVTGPIEDNIQEVRRRIEQDSHSTYDDIEEDFTLSRHHTDYYQ